MKKTLIFTTISIAITILLPVIGTGCSSSDEPKAPVVVDTIEGVCFAGVRDTVVNPDEHDFSLPVEFVDSKKPFEYDLKCVAVYDFDKDLFCTENPWIQQSLNIDEDNTINMGWLTAKLEIVDGIRMLTVHVCSNNEIDIRPEPRAVKLDFESDAINGKVYTASISFEQTLPVNGNWSIIRNAYDYSPQMPMDVPSSAGEYIITPLYPNTMAPLVDIDWIIIGTQPDWATLSKVQVDDMDVIKVTVTENNTGASRETNNSIYYNQVDHLGLSYYTYCYFYGKPIIVRQEAK